MRLSSTNSRLNKSFNFCMIKSLLLILTLLVIACSDKNTSTTQRVYLTPDILCGTVQFTDGCSPSLDSLISFGLALIHHMTYEDAEYTFNKVIENDPDCFWGYWGKAMTYIHPLWPDIMDTATLEKGYILCMQAFSLAKTEKEKLYAGAVTAYYEDGVNKTQQERLAAFRDGWMEARKNLPDDIEAQMFSVLAMLATVSPADKSYRVQLEVGETAEKVLNIIPDHPAGFHYAIHAYDVPPLAHKALDVARNYYKIAPEIPHALHMPSHIFTRLGYWEESIEMNSRSANAALRLPAGDQISGHYSHALDYLCYAYLQISEFEKAEEIVNVLSTLIGEFQAVGATAYSLAAIPARILLEYHNWDEAANLSVVNYNNFRWEKFPMYEALTYYAKGIGAGRSGDTAVAIKSLEKLEALQSSFKGSESNKYWYNQLEIQIQAVKAWLHFAKNEKDKAVEIMMDAADLEDATEKNPITPGHLLPVREMLADLFMEIGQPNEAHNHYVRSLENNPNRFNSLYGAGRSAELIGDVKKASFYFNGLIKLNENSDRQQVQYAKGYLGKKLLSMN